MAGSSERRSILAIVAGSTPVQIFLTLVVHSIYASVLALSLVPSAWLLVTAARGLAEAPVVPASLYGAAALAGALYLYLFWGVLVQAGLIRLLSLGIGPGRYPAASLTTLRWLIFSGIYTISMRTILPLVPVTFLTNAYFRIIGCRVGQRVKLNTYTLNDAYLLTLGDDVIIGGQTDISCHLFEHNHLILRPITIGSGTLVGAHCYIAPGVTIGSRCVIGLYTYLRAGHSVPDGAVVTSLAGIDVHTARTIERGRLRVGREAG